jgi:hypothetical protein
MRVKFSGHVRDKSGKSRFALSAPQPALINWDRSEDWLVQQLGLEDILRDRIVIPPAGASREITVPQARMALTQFEQDIAQALAFHKGGAVDTLVIDGGSLCLDVITIVTLDEATNPNSTFRYAGRNAYIKNLFNQLNESGVNVVWTSKAKGMWAGNQRVPGMFVPDCHDDIPFMVDVNVQFVMEPSPQGAAFYGIIGTNAFNPALVGKRFANLDWAQLMVWLGRPPRGAETGEPPNPRPPSPDSADARPMHMLHTPCRRPDHSALTSESHLVTNGDFPQVQR